MQTVGFTNRRSPEAAAYRRLYGTARWKRARLAQLMIQPLCERCSQMGLVVPATVVHHRRPHKGDLVLFFDPGNLESSCAPHHDGIIQSEERTGHRKGSADDGRPIDPRHPWNA